MDYQKFRLDYEASGLSQKAFGESRSMSSSMVSYYLRRAREEEQQKADTGLFQEVCVNAPIPISRQIKITTPDGIQITIPV